MLLVTTGFNYELNSINTNVTMKTLLEVFGSLDEIKLVFF